MNRARLTHCKFLALLVVCTVLAACHHAPNGYARQSTHLPHDVHVFIEHGDSCEYWRTQKPFAFDDERPSFVIDQTQRYCVLKEEERARLAKKYAKRADVQAALAAVPE